LHIPSKTIQKKKRSEPTDNNSRQESDQCIFIRCPPPSYEILTVECRPLKKISEVKSEIQAKFELHPSEYILQISGKWTTITRDGCSLADYNIHKNSTLDIKFLHPNTEPIVDNNSLRGGADDSAEEDNTYKYKEDYEEDDDDFDEMRGGKGKCCHISSFFYGNTRPNFYLYCSLVIYLPFALQRQYQRKHQ